MRVTSQSLIKVRITEQLATTKYLSKDSPQRADHFGYRVVASVEMIQEHPRIGRVVPEFNQQDLHEVIVSPYRIIYRLNEESKLIQVIRVWDATRDTPEIE